LATPVSSISTQEEYEEVADHHHDLIGDWSLFVHFVLLNLSLESVLERLMSSCMN